MSRQQNETTAPAWPPSAEAKLNDPSIHKILSRGQGDPWTTFARQQQPPSIGQNPWCPMAYRGSISVLSDDGPFLEPPPGDARFPYEDVASVTGRPGHEATGSAHVQQLLNGFQIGNPGPHLPSMRDSTIDAASTFSASTAGTGLRGPLKCKQCDKVFKSQSSLKKHTLSHSRPHRCNYPACSKKDGFSTPNDLQRHKESVHKEARDVYQCTTGDCAGASQPKWWPRKDNFRTHMFKVHKMDISPDDAIAYSVRLDPKIANTAPSSEVTTSEDLADAQLAGTGNEVAESTLMDVDQFAYFLANSDSHHFRNLSGQAGVDVGEGSYSLQGFEPPDFGGQSFTTQTIPAANSSIFMTSMVSDTSYQMPPQPGPPSQGVSAVDEIQVAYSPKTGSGLSSSGPRENLSAASSQKVNAPSHDVLVNDGWTNSQLVDHLETFPVELLRQALRSKQDSKTPKNSNEPEENSHPKSRYQCIECKKVCNRACELKKHMKRHDRPYGCTVKDCGKNFGSKNDWKRHESAQHEPVEAWACDEDGCIAICEDRLAFMQHLMEAHDMVHDEDLRSRAQSCHIGRQCDAKFWCGFCGRVIEIDDIMSQDDGSNGSPWSRRFDHIDCHLFGKNGFEKKDKSHWRFLEDGAKGESGLSRRSMDERSTTASLRSGNTSHGVPYKRKGSENADSRPRKRADAQWAPRNHRGNG